MYHANSWTHFMPDTYLAVHVLLSNCKQASAKIRASISGPWSWHLPVCLQNCVFLTQLFSKKNKLRYCHHSGVVGRGVALVAVIVFVVVTNFNLGDNFKSTEAKLVKLHTLVHYQEFYNLAIGHNSAMLFDKVMPLLKFEVCLCVDYRGEA